MPIPRTLIPVCLALVAAACHSERRPCQIGTRQECPCPDGSPSFQDCLPDGSAWGPCRGCRLPEIRWTRSLEIGGRDPDGRPIGGTEIRSLVVFDGKLFAGNGIWMDTQDGDPEQPGPQVFVLDRPETEGGSWTVDFEWSQRIDRPGTAQDGLHRYLTLSIMKPVTFRRGGDGSVLERPVSLLVAGFWDRLKATDAYTRNLAGQWHRVSLVEPGTCRQHIRSLGLHTDRVTGADILLAGTSGQAECPSRIYRGVYDPDSPAGIRFDPVPEAWVEPPGADDRATSFAVANGAVYATVCGKLYRRQDGPRPTWKRVFSHPDDFCWPQPGENGFRGATAIAEDGGQGLVVAMEGWKPHIGRIELLPQLTHRLELDSQVVLQEALGFPVTYVIVAYNHMTPFQAPGLEPVLLMGLEASTPKDPQAWNSWAPQAWFFIRYPDASYQLREIADPAIQPRPALVSTRTLCPSPFESEKGRVIYAGGFDANHMPCHDSAWLYRGELQ